MTANARVNAWSNVVMNLGTGLTAAAAYRLFVDQKVDLTAGLWILVSALLFALGNGVLVLLEESHLDDL